MKICLLLFCSLMITLSCRAQGYVDQEGVAALLETQGTAALVQPVSWHTYAISNRQKTLMAVTGSLQQHLDSLPGGMAGMRLHVIELANRVCAKYLLQRQELLVPDSFPDDYRAYAPYPFHYEGADSIAKLFVVDKYTQTFGAYEYGHLVRWGLASTGIEDEHTPNGRFAFIWKQEYRESSEAPPGEVWKLHWVYNFNEPRGIHVHQYALPIAQAASHGCVRVAEADARWNFFWAEPGSTVLVLNHSPLYLAAHWSGRAPDVYSLINLPPDPMGIPDGLKPEAVAER